MTETEGSVAEQTAQPWIPTDTDFGARLAAIRHRMGWNIKEAARECQVPAATWRLWEVDGAIPRNIITMAMTVATRTGCDYLWLVHGPQRGGATPNGRWGREAHVVAMIPPAGRGERNLEPLTRSVRQTRPIIHGSPRPLAPAVL